jgi:AcrR family transcriptional regulator
MVEQSVSDRILFAAHGLFMSYGIRSVSMDDIAEHLAISKKTIYQSFTDKDSLVEKVVQMVLRGNQAICEEDRSKADNAIHQLLLSMGRMEEMFGAMNPAVLFDLKKYHPEGYKHFLKFKNEYLVDLVRNNLVRGIEEGLFRPEMNPDITARFRVESMLLVFEPDFSSGIKYNLVELKKEILSLYLFGLVSIKGHKLLDRYLEKNK